MKIINAVAKASHAKPSDVLKQLQDDNYQLEIDNDTQTIQGVHFEDLENFLIIRESVVNNYLEGWQPTRDDIIYLSESYDHPNPVAEVWYNQIFGDNSLVAKC